MEFYLDLLVSIVALGIIVQHAWALKGHFQSERMTGRARVISLAVVLTSICFMILLWTQSQPAMPQIIGIVLALASLALFWGAISASRSARLRFAFDQQHPQSLVTSGPYKYVRHPFYTSYLLFWIGWGLATWSLWAIVPVVVMTILYVQAARLEERLFAATPLAVEYASYRQRAGLFWPKIGSRA